MIKIYKLIDNTNDNCYIGSTNELQHRMNNHFYRKDCSCKCILDNNNYHYIVLEECDESIRFEREQHHIDNTKNCVNIRRAFGIDKDKIKVYHNQKEKQYKKEYYENNQDKIKVYHKKWYEYKYSWGGDKRSSNNLLLIDVNLFL